MLDATTTHIVCVNVCMCVSLLHHSQVDHAYREIDKLISQMEILQMKNRDLESRCEDLQQKNKHLTAVISLLKVR